MVQMRGLGAKGRGGRPVDGPATMRVICPKCDARIGERCRIYRVIDGVQAYIERYRIKFHDERRAAARPNPRPDTG